MRGTSPGLSVTALSLFTAIGHDPEQACAAIRADISGVGEHPFFNVETGDPEWDEPEPLLAALVPGLASTLTGRDRVLRLALMGLRSLCERARLLRAELGRTAWVLAVPFPDDEVVGWLLDTSFAGEVCEQAGLKPFEVCRVEASGHTAVLRALGEANAILEGGGADRVIVLGVDSYHDAARLSGLDRGYRLRSARCKDGFLPGEAAVALMVERKPTRPVLARLSSPSFAVEPRTILGELSSSGSGLCQAIVGQLGSGASALGARWVLCDLNGESYRAFEWGLAQARLAESFGSLRRLVHPAACTGDVGAATGGVLIACALQGFARGYAPAERALVWTSSDQGARGALLVQARGEGRP